MTLERGSSQKSFIGRGRELAELGSGLSEAIPGRGRLFLLSGEPGIGKTRLADEFSTMAAGRGTIVIWGRSTRGTRRLSMFASVGNPVRGLRQDRKSVV